MHKGLCIESTRRTLISGFMTLDQGQMHAFVGSEASGLFSWHWHSSLKAGNSQFKWSNFSGMIINSYFFFLKIDLWGKLIYYGDEDWLISSTILRPAVLPPDASVSSLWLGTFHGNHKHLQLVHTGEKAGGASRSQLTVPGILLEVT